jgi:hypothetical protein
MKLRPVAGELYLADGWRDGRTGIRDKASSRPSQFCERANNYTKTFKHKAYAYILLGLRSLQEESKRMKKERLHRCTVLFTVQQNTKRLLNKPNRKN